MALAELIVQMEPNQYDELILEQENTADLLSRMNDMWGGFFARMKVMGDSFAKRDQQVLNELGDNELAGPMDTLVDIMESVEEKLEEMLGFFITDAKKRYRREKLEGMDDAEAEREAAAKKKAKGKGGQKLPKKEDDDDGFDLGEWLKSWGTGLAMGAFGGLGFALKGKLDALKELPKKMKKLSKAIPNVFKALGRFAIIITGIYNGIKGFIEGFTLNKDDTIIRKIFRGLTTGLREVVRAFFIWPITMVQELFAMIFDAMGMTKVSEFIRKVDIDSLFTKITDPFINFVTELFGWIGDAINDLVAGTKDYLKKKAIDFGVAGFLYGFDRETDGAVPTAADTDTITFSTDNNNRRSRKNTRVAVNETQLRAGIANGTFDENSEPVQEALERFEEQKLELARDRIVRINQAVEDKDITKEEGSGMIKQIMKSYEGSEIDTNMLAKALEVTKEWRESQEKIYKADPTAPKLSKNELKTKALIKQEQERADLMSAPAGSGSVAVDARVQNSSSTTHVNQFLAPVPSAVDHNDGVRTRRYLRDSR